MTEKVPPTVDDFIAHVKRAQDEMFHKTLEAIEVVHASAPTLTVDNPRLRPGWIGKGLGAVVKRDRRGEFKSWYREGQTSGRPSRRMPIEKEMSDAFDQWADAVRCSVPSQCKARVLGQRSGVSRRANSLDSQIMAMRAKLLQQHKTRIPKRIALALDCNVEYVRQVVRKHSRRAEI